MGAGVRKLFSALALAVVVAALVPVAVVAQTPIRFGAQINFADDADLGIGARIKADTPRLISGAPLSIIGSFDFYFPGNNVTYFELNGNVAYNFTIAGSPLRPYAGGGLNIARASVDVPGGGSVSNTDIGLNLLGGITFRPMGRVQPFVELKFEAGGGEQVIVTGGLYF